MLCSASRLSDSRMVSAGPMVTTFTPFLASKLAIVMFGSLSAGTARARTRQSAVSERRCSVPIVLAGLILPGAGRRRELAQGGEPAEGGGHAVRAGERGGRAGGSGPRPAQ